MSALSCRSIFFHELKWFKDLWADKSICFVSTIEVARYWVRDLAEKKSFVSLSSVSSTVSCSTFFADLQLTQQRSDGEQNLWHLCINWMSSLLLAVELEEIPMGSQPDGEDQRILLLMMFCVAPDVFWMESSSLSLVVLLVPFIRIWFRFIYCNISIHKLVEM